MKNSIIEQFHNSIEQFILPVDYTDLIKKTDMVYTFNEVMEGVNLHKYVKQSLANSGRRGYNPLTLMKIVLFAFMKNVRSTRQIEEACRKNIDFMWLANFAKPSHTTIAHFITQHQELIEQLFYEINQCIVGKHQIDTSTLYIDGTKLEANANKYTFVWKKVVLTNQPKLMKKITKLLKEVNALDDFNHFEVQENYTYEEVEVICEHIGDYVYEQDIEFVNGKGTRKHVAQRLVEKAAEYCDKLNEYIEKVTLCGENRNSYSKTDVDATFMCMKEDHMRNAQLKPGYNLQIGVSDEYIMHAAVYQDRNDYKTFIPFLEGYKQQ